MPPIDTMSWSPWKRMALRSYWSVVISCCVSPVTTTALSSEAHASIAPSAEYQTVWAASVPTCVSSPPSFQRKTPPPTTIAASLPSGAISALFTAPASVPTSRASASDAWTSTTKARFWKKYMARNPRFEVVKRFSRSVLEPLATRTGFPSSGR